MAARFISLRASWNTNLKLICAFLVIASQIQVVDLKADDSSVYAKEAIVVSDAVSLDVRTDNLRKAIPNTPPEIIERADLIEPGKIRIYSAPIRFIQDGEYRPIELSWVKSESNIVSCDTNTVKSVITKDGWRWCGNDEWNLSIRPSGAGERMEAQKVEPGTVEVSGLWKDGSRTRYKLIRGGIKESIILDSAPEKAVWSYDLIQGPEVKIKTDGAEVHITSHDKLVAILPRPVAIDSNGRKARGSYEINETVLSVLFDQEWFDSKDRGYPVIVDPTVTEDAGICRYGGASYHEGKWVFLKFNLPELGGVTGCTLTITVDSNFLEDTLTTHAYTSDDASWTTGTDGATLEAITVTSSLDSEALTGSTSDPVVFDVFGSDADGESIAYVYDNEEDPVDHTIKLAWGTGNGDIATGTTMFALWTAEGEEIEFCGPSSANPPYLEFTYSGVAGSRAPVGSGSVGILGL